MATSALEGQKGQFYPSPSDSPLGCGYTHKAWEIGRCLRFPPKPKPTAKLGAIIQTRKLAAGTAIQETVNKCILTVN